MNVGVRVYISIFVASLLLLLAYRVRREVASRRARSLDSEDATAARVEARPVPECLPCGDVEGGDLPVAVAVKIDEADIALARCA